MYKPLPDNVTIKDSGIHGLGLFSTEPINKGFLLGKIHIPMVSEENNFYRTPMGAFGNHSDNPNCSKVLMEDGSWWIFTNRDITSGEELTWKYTLYEIP